MEQSPTDHEAFLRLFTRFEGNVRAYVASLLPTTEGVDDVMQESSVVLWRKFSDFDQAGAESPEQAALAMLPNLRALVNFIRTNNRMPTRAEADKLSASRDWSDILPGAADFDQKVATSKT